MRPSVHVAAVLASLCAFAGVADTQPNPASAAGPPAIATSLGRTAVWVGDRFTYTVEVTCPRGVDILEDDLSKDRVKFEGLDVVSADVERSDEPGGTIRRRFRYVLASYSVDAQAVRIPAVRVRYYVRRAGLRLEDAAPAGDVLVPEATVALRSTLPDSDEGLLLRDRRPLATRPALFAAAQSIGVALIVVSIAPAVVWGAAALSKARRRRRHKSTRRIRRDERATLEAVRLLDVDNPDGRREVFTRIDALVRQHLHDACGVAGRSLVPGELAAALEGSSGHAPAGTAALLALCDTARYGPPHALPSAEACRDAVAQAEHVLSGRP